MHQTQVQPIPSLLILGVGTLDSSNLFLLHLPIMAVVFQYGFLTVGMLGYIYQSQVLGEQPWVIISHFQIFVDEKEGETMGFI